MTMDRAAVVDALDLRPVIGGRAVDAGTPTITVLDPNSGTTLASVCDVGVAIDRSQDYV